MAWNSIDIEITEQPDLRFSANGLTICTIYYNKQHFVAFAELAEELNELLMVGDTIRVWGYYKDYVFQRTRDGGEYSREDFIIHKWGRIN